MAFNGSKNFKKNDVIRFFQSTGMQVGPDLDAATGYEETVYRFRIPTHRSEWIDRSLLVIEDWMTGLDFDEKEVDAERKVVVEEWRRRQEVRYRTEKRFQPVLYNDSRHVMRRPMGRPEILKTVGADELKRFYRDWYRPELMAVVVVGDISVAEIEAEITRRFSGLENPPDSPLRGATAFRRTPIFDSKR